VRKKSEEGRRREGRGGKRRKDLEKMVITVKCS
jgi:hypothetical protein